MSAVSLDAVISLAEAKGIPYKLETSPYTGQLTVYTKHGDSEVTVPTGSAVSTNVLTQRINADLRSQSIDAKCESVGYSGTVFSDSYYPQVWIATTATANNELAYQQDGAVSALAYLPFIVLGAILATISTVAIAWYLCYIGNNTYNYFDPTDNTYKSIVGAQNFTSTMNARYWYVCSKDGYAIGPKNQYPDLKKFNDEHANEIQLWRQHCDQAIDIISPNLTQAGSGIVNTIVLGAVAIGAIVVAVKVLPGWLKYSSRKSEKSTVSSVSLDDYAGGDEGWV